MISAFELNKEIGERIPWFVPFLIGFLAFITAIFLDRRDK